MDKYFNQQTITQFEMTNVRKGDFTAVNNKVIIQASQTLSGNGFKFFIYLCGCAFKKTINLSKVDVCNKTGISKPSYFKIKKELIDNGYLKQITEDEFVFKDCPDVL